MSDLRRIVSAVNPRASVTELRTAASLIDDATRQPSFRMTLLSWFAAVSVLLAAIGVYGLVAQSIVQRRRELAIRTALDANATDLVRRVVQGALVTAVAGVAAGSVAAIALGRVLEALLYGVNARDVVSLGGAAVVLLVVAAAAAFIPALAATRSDPVTILRKD
jgi:putative ABC transport system permease protein